MPTPEPRYKKLRALQQVCVLLDLDPARVLRHSGLSADLMTQEDKGITAETYFAVWNTILTLSPRTDVPLFLGRAYAQGPFDASVYAFNYSPDVRTGLGRLAVFRPLKGPCRIELALAAGGQDLLLGASGPLAIPPSMQMLEIVNIVETIRIATGKPVAPILWSLAPGYQVTPTEIDYLGSAPTPAGRAMMRFSDADLDLPLLSRDPEQWMEVEAALRRRLNASQSGQATAHRVRKALAELLPGGRAGLADVARHLNLSRRSLQRRLTEEGQSFQQILASTRQDLAMTYLARADITIEEIAYLLAFGAPNSFYRAFQAWTGRTPMAMRNSLMNRQSQL